jgi:DNA-binding transcriptional regulator YiaG
MESVPADDMPALLAEVRALAASGEAKAIREAANIRLAEIARAIGVSFQAVASWESGNRCPTGEHAVRYLDVLWQLRRINGRKAWG